MTMKTLIVIVIFIVIAVVAFLVVGKGLSIMMGWFGL